MSRTQWHKLHELTPWDAYALFRMSNAANLRGHGPDVDWQARFARHRPTPTAPAVRTEVSDGVIRLRPEGRPTQLQLGILVAALRNLRVSNPRDRFDPLLPWRLQPLIGWDAINKPNSWRRRTWVAPQELAHERQPYPAGWDGIAAMLSKEPERLFTAAEIAHVATHAIAATLTGAAAQDFWRANR